jgi:branched-chain amino acid transport system ATP-binding protein
MTTALQFHEVSGGYGTTQVLHGVDLIVPAGATVALLGANGAGKSTLLKVAAGLIRPTGGRVTLEGRDITNQPEHFRARNGLCLVPEGRSIFRQLSVRENLAMFVGGRGVGEAVDRAAAMFPILRDRLSQLAGTMSGGQQQMLALCRAVVTDARVVLADELSMGLAPIVLDEIFAAVKALSDEGRSILLVEQYATRAVGVADYVYIMHKGRVVFVGEPEQCLDEHVFERYVGSVA